MCIVVRKIQPLNTRKWLSGDQDVTKITKYLHVQSFVTSFQIVPVLRILKNLGYVAVECIQLAEDRDPWRAVVNSMKNLEVEFLPFWTVTLRQWIIGPRRFEATYCRHLQMLLGCFEHWRWGHYLSSTGRHPITHWRSFTSRRTISAVMQLWYSQNSQPWGYKNYLKTWLTEQLLASQDWPCRVE
jgi:hypothetical protein